MNRETFGRCSRSNGQKPRAATKVIKNKISVLQKRATSREAGEKKPDEIPNPKNGPKKHHYVYFVIEKVFFQSIRPLFSLLILLAPITLPFLWRWSEECFPKVLVSQRAAASLAGFSVVCFDFRITCVKK